MALLKRHLLRVQTRRGGCDSHKEFIMPKPKGMTEDEPVEGGDRGGAGASKGEGKTERRPWPADGPRKGRKRSILIFFTFLGAMVPAAAAAT